MAGNTAWGIGVREWEKFKKKAGMYTPEKSKDSESFSYRDYFLFPQMISSPELWILP